MNQILAVKVSDVRKEFDRLYVSDETGAKRADASEPPA
jgi:hypothetical protein